MKPKKFRKNTKAGKRPVTEKLSEEEALNETPVTDSPEETVSAPESRPYWIHDQILDPDYPDGVKVLPGCVCSVCGFRVSFERDACPHCGAVMRQPETTE